MTNEGLKKCIRCEARMSRGHDVCPSCRERQPGSHLGAFWAVFVATLLAWIAFH